MTKVAGFQAKCRRVLKAALKVMSVIPCILAFIHASIATDLRIPFPYDAEESDRKTDTVPYYFNAFTVLRGKVVQVYVGNIAADFGPVASMALVAALTADHKSQLFHLYWHTSGFRSEYNNNVFYDRRHRKLRSVSSGYYGDETMRTSEFCHCQLTGVTDSMISRMVSSGIRDVDFTWRLVDFGAKMARADHITDAEWAYGVPNHKQTEWHYLPIAAHHRRLLSKQR